MKWIDIQDEAPKVGSRCIFFMLHWKSGTLAHVSIGDVIKMVDDPERYGRYSQLIDTDFVLDDHGPKMRGYTATHWMPLPHDPQF